MNDISELNDSNTPISFFKENVKLFVNKRNWIKYHTPKNLVQAINCEAGELSQLLLFKDYKHADIWDDKKILTNISDEIADDIIYLIRLIKNEKSYMFFYFCKYAVLCLWCFFNW